MVDPDISNKRTRLKGAFVGSKWRIDCLTPSSYTAKSFRDREVTARPCRSTTPTFSCTNDTSVRTTSSWSCARETTGQVETSAKRKMKYTTRQLFKNFVME